MMFRDAEPFFHWTKPFNRTDPQAMRKK